MSLQPKRGYTDSLPITTILGSKIGRFREAGTEEREVILKHIEIEIESWGHMLNVIEKSASQHGDSKVQQNCRTDVETHQSTLNQIAGEMRYLLNQQEKNWDKLKSLQNAVVSKAYEAKAQRWISSTSLVVGQQNASAIMDVSAKCEAQGRLLLQIRKYQEAQGETMRKILKQQTTQTEAISKILSSQEAMEAQLEMLQDTVLASRERNVKASELETSGEQTVTPPPSSTENLPGGNKRASPTETAPSPTPGDSRSSRTGQRAETPARRQRLSLDKALQSPTSSSHPTMYTSTQRTEMTCNEQGTADTSQEEADLSPPECVPTANKSTYPQCDRCDRFSTKLLFIDKNTENSLSELRRRDIETVRESWETDVIYSGAPEEDGEISHDIIETSPRPENFAEFQASLSIAVAIPDRRLYRLALTYQRDFLKFVPVESSCRKVTVVAEIPKWRDPFRLTLNKIYKTAKNKSLHPKQVAVLLWESISSQGAGQVYSRFRDIRNIHLELLENGHGTHTFEGMVVCIPIRFEEYKDWAQGNSRINCEAFETLWAHGILATVPVRGEPAWCPTKTTYPGSNNKTIFNTVKLITHEYTHPNLPPEDDDDPMKTVVVHFVVLIHHDYILKDAYEILQRMGMGASAATTAAMPFPLRSNIDVRSAVRELIEHYGHSDAAQGNAADRGYAAHHELESVELGSRGQYGPAAPPWSTPRNNAGTSQNLVELSLLD